MNELTENQKFHLLLADISMAAASKTAGSSFQIAEDPYELGALRDNWLGATNDEPFKRRVMAMANVGVAALQGSAPEHILSAAEKFGVPIDTDLAERMATHFTDKREAILRFRR